MIDFGDDISFIRENRLFRLRAAAVIVHDDHVLMAGNEQNSYLYSVGGAVQFGETIEEALVREVREETGHELAIARLLAIHQNFFVDTECGKEAWHELAFYYLMEGWPASLNGATSLNMTGVAERLVWVPLARFADHKAFPLFFAELKTMLNEPAPRFVVTRESLPE